MQQLGREASQTGASHDGGYAPFGSQCALLSSKHFPGNIKISKIKDDFCVVGCSLALKTSAQDKALTAHFKLGRGQKLDCPGMCLCGLCRGADYAQVRDTGMCGYPCPLIFGL